MISSILGTAWLLAKYAFLVGLSVATVVTLFALFHPVRVDLKLRASIIGQRAEFWFWYFFGFFGLGTVASRGNQFFVLQLGSRQWRLWQSRKKRKPPSKPTTEKKPPTSPSPAEEAASTAPLSATPSAAPEPLPKPGSEVATPSPSPAPQKPEPLPVVESPATPTTPSSPPSKPAGPETLAASVSGPIFPSTEPVPEEGPAKAAPKDNAQGPISQPPASTPTVPFSFEEGEAPPKPESRKSEDSSSSGGLGAKFSKVRRKIARALSIIRKVFLKGRAIWRRFSPMGKTLVFDLWNSFWILGPQARIRYGFGEPFLVGMTQGLAAQVGGMLLPWGVYLECMPVFNQDTILIKAQGGVKFAPWRAIFGVVRLLTEKDLWRGLYDLYKWYKSRKSAKSPSKEPIPHGS